MVTTVRYRHGGQSRKARTMLFVFRVSLINFGKV